MKPMFECPECHARRTVTPVVDNGFWCDDCQRWVKELAVANESDHDWRDAQIRELTALVQHLSRGAFVRPWGPWFGGALERMWLTPDGSTTDVA